MNDNRRISDQLKVEREIFPHCIQAPVKYFNRKKSLSNVNKSYKRHFSLPGELTTPIPLSKMENSKQHVSDWLNQMGKKYVISSHREPFVNLNVNCINRDSSSKKNQQYQHIKKRNNMHSKYNKENIRNTISKKINKISKKPSKLLKSKNETIVIHTSDENLSTSCTTSKILDKDHCALMEVHKMHNLHKEICAKSSTNLDETGIMVRDNAFTLRKNCPFFKCSRLSQKINEHNKIYKLKYLNNKINLTITISNETDLFCQSSKCRSPLYSRKSSSAQTDFIENIGQPLKKPFACSKYTQNEGYFEKVTSTNINMTPSLIDDSDDEIGADKHTFNLQVQADVHRSSDLCDEVLTEVKTDHRKRKTRSLKKHSTPASSDSSEKENYDPNRFSKRLKKKKTKISYFKLV